LKSIILVRALFKGAPEIEYAVPDQPEVSKETFCEIIMAHRAWMFTINNPTEEDHPRQWLPDNVRYAIWQKERGDNGTEHFQGYLLLARRGRRLGGMKRMNSRAHWEPRRGTHLQAKKYCSKEESRIEDPEEIGEEPADGVGGRSDLVSVKRMLDEGATDREIADEHFGSWCRYHQAFKRYRQVLLAPYRQWHSYCTVLWGEPGVGKTRHVSEHTSVETTYWLPKPNGTRVFWDGYEGQEDVVIDEFFGWLPRDLMCRLIDRTPFRVETKGGSVPFLARRVWITSNNPPFEWWPKVGLGPMRRRLSGELGACLMMTEGGSTHEMGLNGSSRQVQ
jgi:hypothetical protein